MYECRCVCVRECVCVRARVCFIRKTKTRCVSVRCEREGPSPSPSPFPSHFPWLILSTTGVTPGSKLSKADMAGVSPLHTLQHANSMWSQPKSVSATHCNTLPNTPTHSQHKATRLAADQFYLVAARTCKCATLLHTATHCNTLQHTATHCATLRHTDLMHMHTGRVTNGHALTDLISYAPDITKLHPILLWHIQIES